LWLVSSGSPHSWNLLVSEYAVPAFPVLLL
jgi:hypothetical protein